MSIIAIDPGTLESGYVVMVGLDIIEYGVSKNHDIVDFLSVSSETEMAYEMIASYGMPVGAEVFDTCVWIGRFIQAFGASGCKPVYRRDVKMALCGSNSAKDANVRQAIIDLYPASGGGTTPQIGTKKQPGPLYGVNSHIWPAIGVGLYAQKIIKR